MSIASSWHRLRGFLERWPIIDPFNASRKGYAEGMSTIEQYYNTCKSFREELARIAQHIKSQHIYTSFDFGKLQSIVTEYETWAQANTGVIDAALKSASS